MTMLAELLAPYVERVEEAMRAMVPPMEEAPSFWGQLYYHLGWADEEFQPANSPSGKRVRAALCLMSCEIFADSMEPAVPAAAAVELLHEFSLIHDDIEDGDRSRRHRPTLWTVVGLPQALNAGDGLFALAQRTLLRSVEQGVAAATVLRAQQRFNDAAVSLCIGQHLDMLFERRDSVTPEEYIQMVRGKTACLLAYAGEVGAMMGGAPREQAQIIHDIGEALGLAFQMQDDLLGLWGDPERTGKPVGADIRAKKKSLPVAYALSRPESDRLRRIYTGQIEQATQIKEAQQLIEATGAREYVSTLAQEEAHRAMVLLDELDASAARVAPLRQLVTALIGRDY